MGSSNSVNSCDEHLNPPFEWTKYSKLPQCKSYLLNYQIKEKNATLEQLILKKITEREIKRSENAGKIREKWLQINENKKKKVVIDNEKKIIHAATKKLNQTFPLTHRIFSPFFILIRCKNVELEKIILEKLEKRNKERKLELEAKRKKNNKNDDNRLDMMKNKKIEFCKRHNEKIISAMKSKKYKKPMLISFLIHMSCKNVQLEARVLNRLKLRNEERERKKEKDINEKINNNVNNEKDGNNNQDKYVSVMNEHNNSLQRSTVETYKSFSNECTIGTIGTMASFLSVVSDEDASNTNIKREGKEYDGGNSSDSASNKNDNNEYNGENDENNTNYSSSQIALKKKPCRIDFIMKEKNEKKETFVLSKLKKAEEEIKKKKNERRRKRKVNFHKELLELQKKNRIMFSLRNNDHAQKAEARRKKIFDRKYIQLQIQIRKCEKRSMSREYSSCEGEMDRVDNDDILSYLENKILSVQRNRSMQALKAQEYKESLEKKLKSAQDRRNKWVEKIKEKNGATYARYQEFLSMRESEKRQKLKSLEVKLKEAASRRKNVIEAERSRLSTKLKENKNKTKQIIQAHKNKIEMVKRTSHQKIVEANGRKEKTMEENKIKISQYLQNLINKTEKCRTIVEFRTRELAKKLIKKQNHAKENRLLILQQKVERAKRNMHSPLRKAIHAH